MRAALLTALALVACSKDPKGASSRDGVIAAWKKGGLDPSELKTTKTDVGKDCGAGTVNKLDVLVCTFATDADAKGAEDNGLKWVGDTTGASKALGEMLIVVADRKKVDPQGKIINDLITLPAK